MCESGTKSKILHVILRAADWGETEETLNRRMDCKIFWDSTAVAEVLCGADFKV